MKIYKPYDEYQCMLADWLRDKLDEYGITQKEFAELADLTPAAVTAYVTGRIIPNSYTMYKMVRVFKYLERR